jgi:hypothetical protein
MKRLREIVEKILFAGLKPGEQANQPKKWSWLGPLNGVLERYLSAPAPTDPLYLTNRSLGQKMRSWSLVAVPCVVLAGAIGIMLSNILEPPEIKPAAEPSAKEVAAKILPNIDNNLKLDQNSDVEVLECRVEHTGGSRVWGTVRNNTSHAMAAAHLVVDLTDMNGSQVGGVEILVENLPPSKSKNFSQPIAQHKAAFALVREVGPTR